MFGSTFTTRPIGSRGKRLKKLKYFSFILKEVFSPKNLLKMNTTTNNETNNNNTSSFEEKDTFAADVIAHWARVSENSYTALDAFLTEQVTNTDTDNVYYYDRTAEDRASEDEESEDDEESIAGFQRQFNEANEQQQLENYENCKFQLDFNREMWSARVLECFQHYIEGYEAEKRMPDYYNRFATKYAEGVKLWAKFGLSKEQYDAQIVYDNAVSELDSYNLSCLEAREDNPEPEYELSLRTIIETFELQMEQESAAQAKKEDESDWWIETVDWSAAVEPGVISKYQDMMLSINEDEALDADDADDAEDEALDADDADERYRDFMENQREEDLESARQNLLDSF